MTQNNHDGEAPVFDLLGMKSTFELSLLPELIYLLVSSLKVE